MKKLFYILTFCLISQLALAAGNGGGSSEVDYYKDAVSLVKRAGKLETKGKLDKAKELYSKAFKNLEKANKKDKDNPDILNYLGLCSAKLGFDENSEIYYLLGLELNDQHNSIKYNLGVFYKNQNRISDTREILNSLKNCGCEEYENLKMQIN